MAKQVADPWMIFHGGWYYSSESRNGRHIFIRRARTIAGIGQDAGVRVWTAPARGKNSDNLWSPELHLIDGRWFIYYAANDGLYENHRMWVLESEGSDPCGRYRCRGALETGGWAVDGTVLRPGDGRRYFVWSGWPGKRNGPQNLYLAPMRDPLTISGPRVLIAAPDQPWERAALPICEGPQSLKRNGDMFLLYSAGGSWTADCCLGLLHNQTRDMLNPAAWVKHGPVFHKTEQVWGIGHCSVAKSLCQTEDWFVYRAKPSCQPDWGASGQVQARRFTWNSDGFPDFNLPRARAAAAELSLKPRSRAFRWAGQPLSSPKP